MKRIVILLFASLPFLFSFSQQPDKRLAGVDALLQQVLKDWKAPGFAVAVVEKNNVVYAKGFGYRDYEKKLPVTPNTLFGIGSCTKAFTASLIGILNKEGLVNFDRPIHEYLPSLQFFNNVMTDDITLRDMMCHRTGLPRHDYSWYLFPTASRDTLLQRIHYMEPTASVGAKWQYNNFMYFLQGLVAEKKFHQTWEEAVKTNLLVPLGMQRSNFSVTDFASEPDAAFGYGLKHDSSTKRIPYFAMDAIGPAGSINSSANDMTHWLKTWIHGGNYYGKQIIPEAFASEAISSQMIVTSALPRKESPDVFFANYGFGWFLTSYRGHYQAEHGGNVDGFTASTCFYPSDSLGIVILCNQDESVVPTLVRNIISDRMLNLPVRDWNKDYQSQRVQMKAAADSASKLKIANSTKTAAPSSHPIQDYTGTYSHPGYGTFDIRVIGDSLMAIFKLRRFWLRHDLYDVFQPFYVDPVDGIDTADNVQLRMQFVLDLLGNVNKVAITGFEPGLKPLEFSRQLVDRKLSIAELQTYVGEYTTGKATGKIYLKGNTLYMFIPGQPEFELVATGKNEFGFKNMNGFNLHFDMKDGTVSDVLFIQPNGTFRATPIK